MLRTGYNINIKQTMEVAMTNKILTLTFTWVCIGLMLIGGCATRLSIVKVETPYDEIRVNAIEDVESILDINSPTCY